MGGVVCFWVFEMIFRMLEFEWVLEDICVGVLFCRIIGV